MTTELKKTFAELGYSHMDTAEIVTLLNRVLASYAVYQQKLRNYHWNVDGPDFFELHGLFESMYTRATNETDEIAERIRLFGQRPLSSFTEFLQNTEIRENFKAITSFEMAKKILGDIRVLLQMMEEAVIAAQKINDNGSEYMLKSFIYNLEKEHWQLTAWIKQKV